MTQDEITKIKIDLAEEANRLGKLRVVIGIAQVVMTSASFIVSIVVLMHLLMR